MPTDRRAPALVARMPRSCRSLLCLRLQASSVNGTAISLRPTTHLWPRIFLLNLTSARVDTGYQVYFPQLPKLLQ